MFLIKFLRYLKGYVKFSATGGFVERFLNLAIRNGIPIWDGHKRNEVYTGYTTARKYKSCRPFARKSGVRLRILEKHGSPFVVYKYRRRTGILVGLLCFGVFLGIMSCFVWRVDVMGDSKVPAHIIEENLAEIGVKPGALKSALNIKELQREMLLRINELSWIAINIQGSTATIEVNDRTMPPEQIDKNTPCNIVAGKSGQIKYLEVYDGTTLIKAGDTVLEGDILVSGIMEDKVGNTKMKHSRAMIIAEVEEEKIISIPLEQTVKTPTGEEKTQNYLRILAFEIPLFFRGEVKAPYFKESKVVAPKLLIFQLPFEIKSNIYKLATEEKAMLTEQEAKKQALVELADFEAQLKQRGEIIQKTANGALLDNGEKVFVLEAVYVCEQDISISKEIFIK